MYPVEPGAGCHVNLASDNRFDPLGFAGTVKVDHAVHDAVVGDGNRILPQLPGAFCHAADPAGTVQKAEFCMDM
jgi:hypothetical protein